VKKSPINYRAAQPADVSSIHRLIKELASFENAIEQVETDPAQLLMDGFSQNPAYQAFVAEYNGQVVGFALTFIRYSTCTTIYSYCVLPLMILLYRRTSLANVRIVLIYFHNHTIN
jgi:hypothetical protein